MQFYESSCAFVEALTGWKPKADELRATIGAVVGAAERRSGCGCGAIGDVCGCTMGPIDSPMPVMVLLLPEAAREAALAPPRDWKNELVGAAGATEADAEMGADAPGPMPSIPFEELAPLWLLPVPDCDRCRFSELSPSARFVRPAPLAEKTNVHNHKDCYD